MDSITVAKFLSIPTAFLLSGYSLGFSQNTVPLVYQQPASVSAKYLEGVFKEGAKVVAPGALIAAGAFGYLAYNARTTNERNMYTAAGVLSICPLVWTRLVMISGINRMLEIAKSSAEAQKADQTGEATRLLQGWVRQNWARAALAFASGAVGFLAQYQ